MPGYRWVVRWCIGHAPMILAGACPEHSRRLVGVAAVGYGNNAYAVLLVVDGVDGSVLARRVLQRLSSGASSCFPSR